MIRRQSWTITALALLMLAVLASAIPKANGAPLQDQTAQPAKPQIKKVPTPNVNPTSGKEMYVAYCASCHGPNGKGNGPVAAALKTQPADLTQLASKNGGKFPDAQVQAAIRGDTNMPSAHGSKEMPVWGPTFWMLGQQSEAQEQLRIHNLTNYLASLQQK
jgi:mono/diheme cytochrome c family protein